MAEPTERSEPLFALSGGESGKRLVLLHGQGVNADAFLRLLDRVDDHWPGRWLAPDLCGHGRSPRSSVYSYGQHAAAVAGLLEQDEEFAVIGHSLGGVVAMLLASGCFGVKVEGALAFSVKTIWRDEEVAKQKEFAQKPSRVFENREDAAERYLLVTGMAGLIEADAPEVANGIVETDGGYALATDQGTVAAVGPDIASIASSATAPLRLVAGDGDPMVDLEHMRHVDKHAQVIAGVGHNLHLEQPNTLWEHFEAFLASL